MLSDDRRERSGSSQAEVPKLISRFPGSLKEASESLVQHDQKHLLQGVIVPPPKEEGRSSNKDPILVSSSLFSFLPDRSFFRFMVCYVTHCLEFHFSYMNWNLTFISLLDGEAVGAPLS